MTINYSYFVPAWNWKLANQINFISGMQIYSTYMFFEIFSGVGQLAELEL